MPGVGDNALLKMAPLLRALADNRPGLDVTDAPRSMFAALELGDGDPAAALEGLRARDPVLAGFVEPMVAVTMAPTIISASEKINVLPSAARLQVDCRVPPGHGEETVRRRIREVLGDGEEFEIDFHEMVVGNGSPLDTPLMAAITNWVAGVEPDARVVPLMLPAFTDSRTFRDAFPDVVAYGFFPQRRKSLYEAWPLMHGKDERIDVRDVGFAVDCYRDVSKELLG
jgi:acetylornithine deacetylase/succinyl-diaminopimelate desuccinylase-like protein